MKTHALKTDPDVFRAMLKGHKTFEMRLDDRGFEVGDCLQLHETKHTGDEMKDGKPLIYTGRMEFMFVRYIMRGPCYGLKEGWVIMS